MKPEGLRLERSHDPAPGGTAAHPAEAGLWEKFLSRGNLGMLSVLFSGAPRK